MPGEDIKVEITFPLWMGPRLEGLEFRFPLTIGRGTPVVTRGLGRGEKTPEVACDSGYCFGMDLECWGVSRSMCKARKGDGCFPFPR